ncbi:hypothetical protein BJX99DRAFT_267167 [Aspergillus californicus]
MSHLRWYNTKGFGEAAAKSHAYNQAVRVGECIHFSALVNVDMNLRNAGGRGWAQVYKVRSYHIPLDEEAQVAMVRNFRKWMPDHHALWTCVQVERLGADDMRVEIGVEAHDPEGGRRVLRA